MKENLLLFDLIFPFWVSTFLSLYVDFLIFQHCVSARDTEIECVCLGCLVFNCGNFQPHFYFILTYSHIFKSITSDCNIVDVFCSLSRNSDSALSVFFFVCFFFFNSTSIIAQIARHQHHVIRFK